MSCSAIASRASAPDAAVCTTNPRGVSTASSRRRLAAMSSTTRTWIGASSSGVGHRVGHHGRTPWPPRRPARVTGSSIVNVLPDVGGALDA